MNTTPAKLSRREQEVASLVADGLTSKEIGARLHITERTVEGHIDSIFNKLDVRSRVQIATWVRAAPADDAPQTLPVPKPAVTRRRISTGWLWLTGGAMGMVAAGVVIATIVFPALTPASLPGPLISTYAGTGLAGGKSADNDLARNTDITAPEGIATGAAGNLVFTDGNRIRTVGPDGRVQTVAGTGDGGFFGDDGSPLQAKLRFSSPGSGEMVGIVVDGKGDVYFSDTGNDRVREITTGGTIITVAGNGRPGHSATTPAHADIGDGRSAVGPNALLFQPRGLALDALGNLYIADTLSNRIRKLDTTTGIITTIAGNGTFGFSGDGGLATQAELAGPEGLAVDPQGNLYVSDTGNDRVREITADGEITTVVGNGATGDSGDGGPATRAALDLPLGLAFDSRGNLYIADAANSVIRKVDVGHTITTVAGIGISGFTGDSKPAVVSELNQPVAVAVSGSELYIADSLNNRIRVVQLG